MYAEMRRLHQYEGMGEISPFQNPALLLNSCFCQAFPTRGTEAEYTRKFILESELWRFCSHW